jgi:tight adherence protein B
MALIFFAFVFMMLLSFGITMVVTKPSSEQRALEKRITHIKASPGLVTGDPSGLLLAAPDAGKYAWIERLVEDFSISGTLQRLIIQSNTNVTLGKFVFTSVMVGLVGGVGVYIFLASPVPALCAAVVATLIPFIVLRIKRGRRLAAFNNGLADSIDMMARSMRAGHSVVAAIGIVAEQAVEPVKSEFNEVFKKQNYGLPLREALMELLDRVPSQDLRVLVTGMMVQKETGGNLAEILDRIAFVIRERMRIHGEIRTHTAQGRLTGYILCGLPIVMLVLLNFINPGYSSVLFDTPTGHKLLYTGVGLLIAGGASIRTIINSIEV